MNRTDAFIYHTFSMKEVSDKASDEHNIKYTYLYFK